MANEKFEPQGQITDVEIKLECLRLATEFGPEFDRQDPIDKAQKYFDWVKKVSSDNPKRTARKKV
jgi:hypothetical protein|tara:strand:+ start:11 stop:205 length:195 start_codon:yes stop_codon:yes gene_type:complete